MAPLHSLIRQIMIHPRLTDIAALLLPPWVTIFMLHRIEVPELGIKGTTPEYLRHCLSYLKQHNYEFISIENAIEYSLENRLPRKKLVAFSLDDGFAEQVNIGSKIFQEFACPSTCFLITDFVDGKQWPWDYQLMYLSAHAKAQTVEIEIEGHRHKIALGTPETESFLLKFVRLVAPASAYETVRLIADAAGVVIPVKAPDNFKPTTWDAVRTAEKTGMQFGPHSASHRILSGLNSDTLDQEILQSQHRLQQECAKPAQIFCYPSGKVDEFDERAISILQRLKLKGALSAEAGYLEATKIQKIRNYRYAIPRLPLPHNFNEFKRYVSWMQLAREYTVKNRLDKFLTTQTN